MGPLAAKSEGERPTSLLAKPYALITAFFHRDTKHTLFEAGKLTVTLMFIISMALILKHVLTDKQVPQQIAGAMLSAGFGKIMFLVIVNIILLIGGQFMEPSGLIVIVAPLVFPDRDRTGRSTPSTSGIIMVVNMEIGMITPPVGLNLFVTSGVAGMPMMRVVKAALPFLAVLFVFLILVTYIPRLSRPILPIGDHGAGDHHQLERGIRKVGTGFRTKLRRQNKILEARLGQARDIPSRSANPSRQAGGKGGHDRVRNQPLSGSRRPPDAPSTSPTAKISAALPGLTDPP